MAETFQTRSPIDGRVVVERPLASDDEIERTLQAAVGAHASWSRLPLAERTERIAALVDRIVADKLRLAEELTLQMGRPSRFAPSEIGGFEERARAMLRLAPEALAEIVPPAREGFSRSIRRESLGLVFVIAPWNYPWLTAVNAVLPALAAGNVVLLKHSEQTPLVAERFVQAAEQAGLPPGVFQYLHLTHEAAARVVGDERVAKVAFTGSVAGGHAIVSAAQQRFIGLGLELGGKDPAYVRADAPIEPTAISLVDGAFFNSGQSCCAIERIYVDRRVVQPFVDAFVAEVERYIVGDPRASETTLGPLVRARNAAVVQAQIDEALARGARSLVDPSRFGKLEPPYMAPQVFIDVDHTMSLMNEETFGPAIGIMPVDGDEAAIALMNDSRYGLTASLWSEDVERVLELADALETGTVFMNRCDYLDPELAWVGVKDSGRGCTLSRVGYDELTRPKSLHLRHRVPGA